MKVDTELVLSLAPEPEAAPVAVVAGIVALAKGAEVVSALERKPELAPTPVPAPVAGLAGAVAFANGADVVL